MTEKNNIQDGIEIEIDYDVISDSSTIKDKHNLFDLTQEKMMGVLDWAYDTTVKGVPGQKSVEELAGEYLTRYEDEDKAIDKLIRVQTTKAATSGFITGLGGIITLPVAIPANISTVILFQMRMIGAIAAIRGYDLKSDEVQTLVYVSLAGLAISDIVKLTGIKFGNRISINLIKKIPGETLKRINQKVGFRFLTKFGEKGIINFGKMIPVVGGVIGGAFDTGSTIFIGKRAKMNFISSEENVNQEAR